MLAAARRRRARGARASSRRSGGSSPRRPGSFGDDASCRSRGRSRSSTRSRPRGLVPQARRPRDLRGRPRRARSRTSPRRTPPYADTALFRHATSSTRSRSTRRSTLPAALAARRPAVYLGALWARLGTPSRAGRPPRSRARPAATGVRLVPRARRPAARAPAARRPSRARAPARAASRRATGCAGGAARGGTCRRARPSAAALEAGLAVVPEPGDDAAERLGARVEDACGPAWFSNPASVPLARPARARTRAGRRRSSAARRRRSRAGRAPAPGMHDRRARGSSGRGAGSRRRRRAARRRASMRRARAPRPCAARSGATSACSRSWPPPT